MFFDCTYIDNFIDGAGNSKRIGRFSGKATAWWLRSPYLGNAQYAWAVYSSGAAGSYIVTNSYGVRPALVLPPEINVSSAAITGQVNIGGVMRELTGAGYINIGGVLRELSDAQVNIGGTLKSLKG